jgi:glycine cleavage system regulatory protein
MRRFSAALAAVAAVALLAGCGVNVGSSDYNEAPGVATEASETFSSDEASSVRSGEQVIRTANISMDVDDVNTSVADISAVAEQLDGFVESQSVQGIGEDATAYITIRVPADNLDALLESIGALGEVSRTSIDSQDVTVQVIDIEARISALEDSIARLRELQGQAASVADLVAVESELAARQSELESLTAQRDYLARQVEMSTVYVSLDQRDVGPGVSPDFLGGLENGWNAMIALTAGLITAAGFLLPFLAVAGVITAIVLIIVVISRRDSKEKL